MRTMGKYRLYIDSFCGPAAELKRGHRQPDDILSALKINPCVSTFDMSEHGWLVDGINALKKSGRIIELNEPYPWHRFKIVEDSASAQEDTSSIEHGLLDPRIVDTMVDRFLSWPLPNSVCADICATNPNYPHSRNGTNLLTKVEAKSMVEYVLSGVSDAT
jgi:hypothetical protein